MDALLRELGKTTLTFLPIEVLFQLRLCSSLFFQSTEDYAEYRILALNGYDWVLNESNPTKSKLLKLYLSTQKGIMIMGGNIEHRKCQLFQPITSRFTNRGTFAFKRVEGFAAAFFHGRVYVISGCFDPTLGSVEVYDPIANAWTESTRLPRRIDALSAVSSPTHLYVVGGHDHQLKRRSDVIYVMNEETGDWSESPVRLVSGRSNHSCAYYNNAIWIAGGVLGPSSSVSPMSSSSSSSSSSSGSSSSSSSSSSSGSSSSSSSSGSSSSGSGSNNGTNMSGGKSSSGSASHQQQQPTSTSPRSVAAAAVEIVDLIAGTVTVGPSMRHERYQLKLVVVNVCLYAVAGKQTIPPPPPHTHNNPFHIHYHSSNTTIPLTQTFSPQQILFIHHLLALVGDMNGAESSETTIEVLDKETNTWRVVTTFPKRSPPLNQPN